MKHIQEYKTLGILFAPALGGNHIANMISTSPYVENRVNTTDYEQNLLDLYSNSKGLSFHAEQFLNFSSEDYTKPYNLILANIDSDNIRETYFKGVGSTFSYYLFQKAVYSGNTEFITPTGSVQIDISNIDSLPKITSKESLSIVKKMIGNPFTFCDQNHGLGGVEGDSQGTVTVLKKIKGVEKAFNYKLQYITYHTNKNGGTYWYSEKLNPYANSPKVIISISGTYLPVFNNTTGFSNMCLALICATDKEAIRAQFILSSKLYKFWVEMQKFSGFNPRKLILTLPALSLAQDWTDDTIYKHFSLTQEEIDYVEANVK